MWFLFVGPEVCRWLPSDSSSPRTPLPLAMCLALSTRTQDSNLLDCAHAGHTERIGSLLRSAYGRPMQKDEILGYMQPLLVADTHHTLIGMLRDQSNTLPDRESISVPVLVIWGEQDTWVSPEDAPLWCNAISNCRQEIISGAGHNPMETHTDEFNHMLVDFVLTTTEAVAPTP